MISQDSTRLGSNVRRQRTIPDKVTKAQTADNMTAVNVEGPSRELLGPIGGTARENAHAVLTCEDLVLLLSFSSR